jgi:hypothetical protein
MLLDRAGKSKSVTLILDRLVIEECVLDDVTVLFDFQFGESAGLETVLFRQRSCDLLGVLRVHLFLSGVFFSPLVF